MASSPQRRLFAGTRVRELRGRLNLNQSQLAARVGISVSYLSQIESDDRPLTDAVLIAFSRAFPSDWAELAPAQESMLLAQAMAAAQDTSIPAPPVNEEALRKAIHRQPQLAERLVATHAAYQRALEQLRSIDDALDRGGQEIPLPWEEVRDWFHGEGNYVDALDREAEQVAAELGLPAGYCAARLEERLASRHAVIIASSRSPGADEPLRSYDPVQRHLKIDPSLPVESRAFLLAHQLVRLEMAGSIRREVDQARLRSQAARNLLSVGLSNYAAGALLMPYGPFRSFAREMRHDVDALRAQFGVSFEQACHRLSTLQRPGACGLPVFFCRVDMAGNITKRHSATRLQFARFGGACPLWVVHEAAAIPDRILVQLAELPEGIRFVSMAKGLVKTTGSYLRQPRRYAVALGCEISHAADFVYADHLELHGEASATPIGISCRICPRSTCEQRAFPPAGRMIEVDPDRRLTVPYSFG